MPTYQKIPLALIDSPPEPMRQDSFLDGMAELISSIAEEGLHQPVGLMAQPDGRYRIIFGHRRSYAVQELAWDTIPAVVYQPGETDSDTAMGTENFQRANVNPVEEGRFYARLARDRNLSHAEIARRFKRPPARVGQLIAVLEGDPNVVEALSANQISIAQAVEINKCHDDFGREQCLHYAAHDNLSAQHIRLWVEQREISGVSQSIQELKEEGQADQAINYRQQIQCCICAEWPQIVDSIHRVMCNDCWNTTVMLHQAYQQNVARLANEEMPAEEKGH